MSVLGFVSISGYLFIFLNKYLFFPFKLIEGLLLRSWPVI